MDIVSVIIGTTPGILILRYVLVEIRIWLLDEKIKEDEKKCQQFP